MSELDPTNPNSSEENKKVKFIAVYKFILEYLFVT